MNQSRLFFGKNIIGNKTYTLYALIYTLMSFFILSSVNNFPDFFNYDQYIRNGTYFPRFSREPFSMWLMQFSGTWNWGAQGYYYLCWILGSLFIFLIPILVGRRYVMLATFILINPVSLVLYQTPRQFLSFSLFTLSVFCAVRIKSVLLIASTLAHTVSGLVSIALSVLLGSDRKFFLLYLILGSLAFFFIANEFYRFYLLEDDIQRGVGRFIYTSFMFALLLVLCYKKPIIDLLVFLSFFFFIIFLYTQTTYAGRLLPYFILLASLYMFNCFSSRHSVFIIQTFFLSSFFVSFVVVIFGMFGYG